MPIQTLLKDEIVQALVKELGLEGESVDAQADAIAQMSENVLARLFLEIFKIVPEEKRAELSATLETGDYGKLRTFLSNFVPKNDPDEFLKGVVQDEIAETKDIVQKRLASA